MRDCENEKLLIFKELCRAIKLSIRGLFYMEAFVDGKNFLISFSAGRLHLWNQKSAKLLSCEVINTKQFSSHFYSRSDYCCQCFLSMSLSKCVKILARMTRNNLRKFIWVVMRTSGKIFCENSLTAGARSLCKSDLKPTPTNDADYWRQAESRGLALDIPFSEALWKMSFLWKSNVTNIFPFLEEKVFFSRRDFSSVMMPRIFL